MIKEVLRHIAAGETSFYEGRFQFLVAPVNMVEGNEVEALYASRFFPTGKTGVDNAVNEIDGKFALVYYLRRGGETVVLVTPSAVDSAWVPGVSFDSLSQEDRVSLSGSGKVISSVAAIAEKILNDFRNRVVGEVETLSDEELVPNAEERERILHAAKERVNTLLLEDANAEYAPPPLTIACVDALALRWLCRPEVTEKRFAEEHEPAYRERAARIEFSRRCQRRVCEEARTKASPQMKDALAIADALRKAQVAGYKNLRVDCIACDAQISAYVKGKYPDFSLGDATAVELKVAATAPFSLTDGFSSWALEYVSPILKNPYSKRKEDFLNRVSPDMIQKISYGRKVLYEKR